MGIQVAPRITFRHMHDMGLGKSLSYVFVPAYFASQILCFILSCGIRVASMSSVDSIPYSKWCSHIPMGILILLDHRVCHPNSFQPTCYFSSGSIILTFARSILSSLQRCLLHPSQIVFVFLPSHPFSSRTQIS